MTSVSKELNAPAPGILPAFRDTTTAALAAELGRAPRTVAPEEIGVAAEQPLRLS